MIWRRIKQLAGRDRTAPPTQRPRDTAAMRSADAVYLFTEIAGGSLPRFAQAYDLMAQRGLTLRVEGTAFHPTLDISFRVLAQDDAQICSCAFGTEDSIQTTVNVVTDMIGHFAPSDLGLTASFEGRALVARGAPITYPPGQTVDTPDGPVGYPNGRTFHTLQMLSQT